MAGDERSGASVCVCVCVHVCVAHRCVCVSMCVGHTYGVRACLCGIRVCLCGCIAILDSSKIERYKLLFNNLVDPTAQGS